MLPACDHGPFAPWYSARPKTLQAALGIQAAVALGLYWLIPNQHAVCNIISRSSDLRTGLHGAVSLRKRRRLALPAPCLLGHVVPNDRPFNRRVRTRAYSGGSVWDSHPVPLLNMAVCLSSDLLELQAVMSLRCLAHPNLRCSIAAIFARNSQFVNEISNCIS